MATFEVTIETIEIHPHPDADRLEYAQVGLFKSVVRKGLHKTGDEVFYIPEAAILPEPLIETLGLTGMLAGKEKNRVKPVRLRGLLSQGVVAPLSVSPVEVDHSTRNHAEILGITKWEPEVPTNLAGDVESAPDLVRWVDIENIKKFPTMFTEGEMVVVDEKVHGTATCITVDNLNTSTPNVMVTSKGIGAKSFALRESEGNAYWKMFHAHNILGFTQFVAERENAVKVAVFGETYGKIQDLSYGLPGKLGYILFDIHVDGEWLTPEAVEAYATEFGIPMAPRLYAGPYSLETITELAYGPETVSGTEAHIREGVIVRPAATNPENRWEGSRKIGKFVSDDYLTRKGGTEYN